MTRTRLLEAFETMIPPDWGEPEPLRVITGEGDGLKIREVAWGRP